MLYTTESMKASLAIKPGFTIVEMLFVIVVIGILAGIGIVSYSAITGRTADSSVKNSLLSQSGALNKYYAENSRYPATLAEGEIKDLSSDKATYVYTYNSVAKSYCISGVSTRTGSSFFNITSAGAAINAGQCP